MSVNSGGSSSDQSIAANDQVLVKVAVVRMVLEPRLDVDGVEDYYVIDKQTVSESEWFEPRKAAVPRA